MTARRGSARYWLQAAENVRMPWGIRPWNRAWRFRRDDHAAGVRHIVQRLRQIADALEPFAKDETT